LAGSAAAAAMLVLAGGVGPGPAVSPPPPLSLLLHPARAATSKLAATKLIHLCDDRFLFMIPPLFPLVEDIPLSELTRQSVISRQNRERSLERRPVWQFDLDQTEIRQGRIDPNHAGSCVRSSAPARAPNWRGSFPACGSSVEYRVLCAEPLACEGQRGCTLPGAPNTREGHRWPSPFELPRLRSTSGREPYSPA